MVAVLVYGHEYAVKWGPFYKGNIRDQDLVARILAVENIEAIIHFAAYTYVGESVQDPVKYYDNNVLATLEFLKAVLRSPVRRLVFSSTCAVYGTPLKLPINENEKKSPLNPYGQTKQAVECLLEALGSSHKLTATALRYFNAAGADSEGEIGEDHTPETHLIPLAIRAALDPRHTLTVFGDDYNTPDGTCIRDYIHVTDLARAHLAALEQETSNFTAFNIGTGAGISVREIIKEIEVVTGQVVKLKLGARRPGDPDSLVADASKAMRELNWRPLHSSRREIIESAVEWYKRMPPQEDTVSQPSLPRA